MSNRDISIVESVLKLKEPVLNREFFQLGGCEDSDDYYIGNKKGIQIWFDKDDNCLEKDVRQRRLDEPEYNELWEYADQFLLYFKMKKALLADMGASYSPYTTLFSFNEVEFALSIFQKYSELWDQTFVNMSDIYRGIISIVKRTFPKFGYVYLIGEPDGAFKIGKTENPDQRIKTHGVKLPYKDLKYTHTFPCGDMSQTEAALHRFYAPQRLNGEWFLLNESQLECFKQIQYCDDIETMLDALPLPIEELRSRAKAERNKQE